MMMSYYLISIKQLKQHDFDKMIFEFFDFSPHLSVRICICLPLLPNNFVYFSFLFSSSSSFLLFSFSLSRDILWKKTVICLSITSLGIRVHVNIKSKFHIGRALTVAILYPLIRRSGVYLSWKDCLILIWSGLRGSMALILVLIVDLDSRIDSLIRNHFLFHLCMIVLLTLIINGTSSKFLVKFLHLKQGRCEG